MTTFLFWNLNKKPLLPRVREIVDEYKVDVVSLTECLPLDPAVASALGSDWAAHDSPQNKLRVVANRRKVQLKHAYLGPAGDVAVKHLATDGRPDILFATLHLTSKLKTEADDRLTLGISAAKAVRRVEQDIGYRRTIVVGDFNLNPWEGALFSSHGFHAHMSQRLTRHVHGRVVAGVKMPSFFNPMWQFLTDRGSSPTGTYRLEASTPTNPIWHTLDQVLIRPALSRRLSEVRIIESTSSGSLVTRHGWPDKKNASDHLPLLFRLKW